MHSPHPGPPMRTAPLAVLLTLGCTTWRPVALPAPQEPAWTVTGELRMTSGDGHLLRGTAVTLQGDSLRLTGPQGVAVAQLPREGVTLERHVVDGGRTGALLFLTAGLAVIVVLAVGNSLSGLGGGGYGY